MKVGLVGLPGVGKSAVFGALRGLAVETGYGAGRGKANIGVAKVLRCGVSGDWSGKALVFVGRKSNCLDWCTPIVPVSIFSGGAIHFIVPAIGRELWRLPGYCDSIFSRTDSLQMAS